MPLQERVGLVLALQVVTVSEVRAIQRMVQVWGELNLLVELVASPVVIQEVAQREALVSAEKAAITLEAMVAVIMLASMGAAKVVAQALGIGVVQAVVAEVVIMEAVVDQASQAYQRVHQAEAQVLIT
jgi:hypothetical protein